MNIASSKRRLRGRLSRAATSTRRARYYRCRYCLVLVATNIIVSPTTHNQATAAPATADQQQIDPEAALRWGHHVLRKFGESDRASAFAELDTLAGAGSGSGAFPVGETLFLLGRAHDEGREDIGILRDEAAARELYARAAKMGHPQSQHALAAVLASSADAGGEVEAILYDYFASLGGEVLAHAALGYRYLYG